MRASLLLSVLLIIPCSAGAQRPGSIPTPVRIAPAPAHANTVDATHRTEAQIDALSEALTALTTQVSALQAQVAQLQSQNTVLSTRLTTLQAQDNTAHTQMAGLQTQVATTSTALGTLEASFKSHRHCLAGISLNSLNGIVGDASSGFQNYLVLTVAPPFDNRHRVRTTLESAVSSEGLCTSTM